MKDPKYEQEKHDLARDYAREIPGHDEEMAFRHGYDAGHARAQDRIDEIQSSAMAYAKEAQARIKELEGDCQRKDALLMIAKESIDDSNKYLKLRLDEIQNLQAKLEACEAENASLKDDLETVRSSLKFRNLTAISRLNRLKDSIPIADVKPLVEALKLLDPNNMDHDTYLDIFDCITHPSPSVTDFNSHKFAKPFVEALQAFREKHKEILK